MTMPTSNRFDGVLSAGASTGMSGLVPVVTVRSPGTRDIRGPSGPFKVGQLWVNSTSDLSYQLTSIHPSNGALLATWTVLGTNAGTLDTLTGDAGGAVVPTAGNINVLGTASQLTTTGSGSNLTLSIPSAFIAPGSVTATTTLTATAGAITATNGNLVLGTAGNKILSTSVATTTTGGANSFGTVTLVGGTATVATTAITTNSIVFLTRQTIGATGAAALGQISRGTIVNGTSFVINALLTADATSLATTDVSNIGWMIVN